MRQVTAAVIIEHDRLLLARRGPAESLAGLWELPGGKVEAGETIQECLRRELLEEFEMGTVVGKVVARTFYEYEHGSFDLVALAAERLTEYRLHVHDAVSWLARDEIASLELAPADVDLVRQILASDHWK